MGFECRTWQGMIAKASRKYLFWGFPYGIASPVTMKIVNNGLILGPFAIAAAGAAPVPGIFRNPDGSASVLNQDGTLHTQSNPAHAGTIVAIWGTGVPRLVDGNGGEDGGDIPALVGDLTSQDLVSLSAGLNGPQLPIVYAGGAPGLPGGVFQINARIPAGPGLAPVALILNASGILSPPVTLYVEP